MSRHLTEDQDQFVQSIRTFTQKECGTHEQRRQLTDNGALNHNQDLYEKAARLGWIGASVPAEFGGSGGSVVDECLMLQEMARGGAPIAGVIPTLIVAGAYNRYGSPEQKKDRLAGIVDGETHSIAMSEPHAGSDVASLTCRAEPDGDGWVLNGQKTWISNSQFTKSTLLIARTSQGSRKHHGLTMFEIPAETTGLDAQAIETMGLQEIHDVFLSDCRLPGTAVVGEVDMGWAQLMSGLERERLMIASQLLGIGQRCFDRLVSFVKERQQFGKSISNFQVIRHRIADLVTELECAEAFLYDMAREVTDGEGSKVLASETSMAKLKSTEVARHVALEGMQLMGAAGFAAEYEMEQDVKTTLSATIYGGTSEIQREVIAKQIFGAAS